MNDELVNEYLDRVRRAGGGLPPDRLAELIEDLREHIAAARAELSPETEAAVRTILSRLGEPTEIVAAATVDAPPPSPPAPSPASSPASSSRRRVVIVVAVVLAVCVLLPVVVCLVGLLAYEGSPTEETPSEPVIEAPVPSSLTG